VVEKLVMQWNRSTAIGLALASCTQCGGHGMREFQRGLDKPFHCVFRAIFRACFEHFQECANASEQPGGVTLESNRGPAGYRLYSLKRQEYVADFCLSARRALTAEDYRLFRYVFLLGADNVLCLRYLGLDRGEFFSRIYRIEEILGQYLAELEPYSLFPVDEYMGGSVRAARIGIRSAGFEGSRRRRRERLPMTA
jgi:hypothetical protein